MFRSWTIVTCKTSSLTLLLNLFKAQKFTNTYLTLIFLFLTETNLLQKMLLEVIDFSPVVLPVIMRIGRRQSLEEMFFQNQITFLCPSLSFFGFRKKVPVSWRKDNSCHLKEINVKSAVKLLFIVTDNDTVTGVQVKMLAWHLIQLQSFECFDKSKVFHDESLDLHFLGNYSVEKIERRVSLNVTLIIICLWFVCNSIFISVSKFITQFICIQNLNTLLLNDSKPNFPGIKCSFVVSKSRIRSGYGTCVFRWILGWSILFLMTTNFLSSTSWRLFRFLEKKSFLWLKSWKRSSLMCKGLFFTDLT